VKSYYVKAGKTLEAKCKFWPKCFEDIQEVMMFCSMCGKENDDSAYYCYSCGSQLIQNGPVIPKRIKVDYAGGFSMSSSGSDLNEIQSMSFYVGILLGITLNWLYFTISESTARQATIGKRAIGIVVTDLAGHRISFGRANGRYWGKIISAIILLFGFLMAGFTERKQALHDIMASTLVVEGKK
jgi:hypothetical protein